MPKIKVNPEDIKDLRRRHNLTQNQLADSLYGVSRASIPHWENGRRSCPPLAWWAMKLTWDQIDLWEGER